MNTSRIERSVRGVGVQVLTLALFAYAAPAYVEQESAGGGTNDSYANAEVLGFGAHFASAFAPRGRGEVVHGTIDSANDVDFYVFEVNAGEAVTATVHQRGPSGSADSEVALYKDDGPDAGTDPDLVDYDDDGGVGFHGALFWYADFTGQLRVAVSTPTSTSDPTETVFDYYLSVSTSLATDSTIQETFPDDNDEPLMAHPLPTPDPGAGPGFFQQSPGGVTVRYGTLDPGDIDQYFIDTRFSVVPFLALSLFDNSLGIEDPKLTVTAPDGTILLDDDGGPGFQPMIDVRSWRNSTLTVKVERSRIYYSAFDMEQPYGYWLVVSSVPGSNRTRGCGVGGAGVVLGVAFAWIGWRRRRWARHALGIVAAACLLTLGGTDASAQQSDPDEWPIWNVILGHEGSQGYDQAVYRVGDGQPCVSPVWDHGTRQILSQVDGAPCTVNWFTVSSEPAELRGSVMLARSTTTTCPPTDPLGCPNTSLVLEIERPGGQNFVMALRRSGLAAATSRRTLGEDLNQVDFQNNLMNDLFDARLRDGLLRLAEAEWGSQPLYPVLLLETRAKADTAGCRDLVERFSLRVRWAEALQ